MLSDQIQETIKVLEVSINKFEVVKDKLMEFELCINETIHKELICQEKLLDIIAKLEGLKEIY